MRLLTEVFKKWSKNAFGFLGFDIVRTKGPRVSWTNFESLVQAYELNLNEKDGIVLPNSIRTKLMGRLLGTPPSEAYFIVQALSKTKTVAGDVCEFGVAQGETSALIANEIASTGNKKIHLFDSFEGLPKPTEKDQLKDDIFQLGSMHAYTGTMSSPVDMVRARLKSISFPSDRTIIHRGFIEKLIYEDKNLPKEVSFAFVDFDFYEPIRIALEFLDKVTPVGAIIIVDDYDFFSTGAKTSVDEFIADKNAKRVMYDCFIPNVKYGSFAVLTKKAE